MDGFLVGLDDCTKVIVTYSAALTGRVVGGKGIATFTRRIFFLLLVQCNF